MPARKLGTALAVAAAALATASPAWSLTVDPVVTPDRAVPGDTLTCDPNLGDVQGTPSREYAWVHLDADPDAVIAGATSSQYVAQASDVGHEVGCRVTATDSVEQKQATSAEGSEIDPLPMLDMELTSPQVSGDVGFATDAVTVTVKLVRDDQSTGARRVVAQGSDVTDDGAWEVDLGANAPSTGRDGLVLDYSGPGAPPDAEFSPKTISYDSVSWVTYFGAGGEGDETTDATKAEFGCFDCERIEVRINAQKFQSATRRQSDGMFVLSSPIARSDRLTVREYHRIDGAAQDGSPTLGVIERSLRQIGSNEWTGPTCQADLATTIIRCRGAVRPAGGGNPYVLRLNDGPNVATTFGTFFDDLVAEGNRGHGDFVTGKLPGVTTGDRVQLVRTDLNQVLTTLRVGRLRAHFAEDGKVTGVCTAGTWLDIWRQDSSLFMPVCPASGEMDAQNYGLFAYDDTSGGRTEVRVPEIVDLAPAPDAKVAASSFTVKAATRFYADEVPGYLSTADPVAVRITPEGGGAAIEVANANSASGQSVTVPGAGKYRARWTVTDRNGDTRTLATTFTVTGAAGGGGGRPGAGAAGPGGGPVARAALVGRLALSAVRFRAAGRGGPVAAAAQRRRRRAPVGTVVTYRLTTAATVSFTVRRTLPGRRAGRRCVKPSKRNRAKKACKRAQTLSTFTHAGAAGENRFRFTGRVKSRKLKPGRYTLVARPGAGAAAQRTAFRIVR